MSRTGTIYFDGACLPVNPGGSAYYGIVAVEDGKVVCERAGLVARRSTNNVAEWNAFIEALRLAHELEWKKVRILGDSQLVVNQYNGVWSIRSSHLMRFFRQAKRLSRGLKVRVLWTRRDGNLADEVCHRAFVEDVEKAPKQRAEKEHMHYTVQKNGTNTYTVSKDDGRIYRVSFDPISCTCPFFKRYSSYRLLRRSSITIRCKHHFVVMLKEGLIQRSSDTR
jgi:ribonuclease HI